MTRRSTRYRPTSCRRVLRLLPLVLLWAVLLACRDDSRYYGITRPSHGPDEFWYNLGSDPEWLDPGLATDSASGAVLVNLFSGLTQLHPKTLAPMPDVARDWQVLDGGKRYIFELRKSQWSDGTPLTAHDFVYAFRRVLTPATGSQYASFLFPFLHAEAVYRGALVVEGLPKGTGVDDVKAWVSEQVPDAVVTIDGAHAVVSQSGGIPVARHEALVSALRQQPLSGQSVAVRSAGPEVIGVRAVGDHRLEIRLAKPVPYLLSVLAFYTAMPVPRHLLQAMEARGEDVTHWTRPENMVVNGPYRMTAWEFRRHIWLQKNARYWDAEHVRVPRVKLTMVDSYNTTLNLYKAGELDHIGQSSLPSEFMDYLSRYADFRREKSLSVYFLWLNSKRPPLDDVRVREALSLAIDRERLVKYVTRGGQEPTADLVPDGLSGYRGLGRPLHDPERARQLLREAGYGPNRPLPTVVYKYNTSEGHKQVAEAIQQMWKAELGIDARIENEEWRVYLKSMDGHDFQIGRLGWVADYADPNTFLELLLTGNGSNYGGFSSSAYDALMTRANDSLDPDARLRLLREAEGLAMAQQPLIPLYVYTRSELVKPYVRGSFLNYQTRDMFKYIHIDPALYGGQSAPAETVPPLLLPASARAAAARGEGVIR